MLRCAIRALVDQQQQSAAHLQLQRHLRALHTAISDLEGAGGTAAVAAGAATPAAALQPGVAAALAAGNDATQQQHVQLQQQQQQPVQQQGATWLASAAAGSDRTPSQGASRLSIRAYCPVLADAVRSLEQQQQQQQQQQQWPSKHKQQQRRVKDGAQPAGSTLQHPAALQATAALKAHKQAAARDILSSAVQQLVDQPAELAATAPGAVCSLLLACQRAQVVLPASHIQQLLHAAAQGADQLNRPLIVQSLYAAAHCADPAQTQQRLPPAAHPLLHHTLQQLLQQLPAVPPKAISQVLALHEKARIQLPPASMQALLQHAVQQAYLRSASLLDMQWMLRAASYSSLALPASLDLAPLLSALALAGQQQGGQSGPASAPLAALRAASTLQAALPSGLLQQLLGQALDASGPAASFEGAGLNIGDAAALLKALSCLPTRLQREIQRPRLQQLLQAHLQQALAQRQAGLEHVGGMLASMMRLRVDLPASFLDATLDQVMELMVQLAHAPADAAARDATNSASNSAGRAAALPQLSAKAMSQLLRSLAHFQRVLPADAVAPLTARLLSQEPGAKAISRWIAALAAMGHSLSSEQLQALMQRLLQPRHQRAHQHHQSQQPAQRLFMAAMDANDVGSFLWGAATMGFTLDSQLLRLLLQHQLHRLRPPWTYGVTQSLWAMAAMGAPEDAAAGGGSLCPVPQELLQQALDALLQEQQAASGLAGSDVVDAAHSARPADADKCEDEGRGRVGDVAADDADGPALADPSSSRAWPAVFWQWSIAAWSIALLDAQSCKPQVLQLCRVLAQPHIWQGLRTNEHVQLLWVHLWLCGYQWSTTEGLAGILSAKQLRQIQRARQQQAQGYRRECRDRHAAWLRRVQQAQQQQQSHQNDQDQQGWSSNFAAGQPQHGSDSPDVSGSTPKQQQPQQPGPRPPPQGASNTQFYLHAMARRMRGVVSAELEGLTPDGLFDVDVAVVTTGGLRLALEFDGPWHYSLLAPTPAGTAASSSSSNVDSFHQSNLGSSSSSISGSAAQGASGAAAAAWAARAWAVGGAARQRPDQHGDAQQQQVWLATRTTLFRNRALAARGYRVVAVPFFLWPDSTQPLGRQQLVARLIAQAIDSSGSGGGGSSSGGGGSRGSKGSRRRRR